MLQMAVNDPGLWNVKLFEVVFQAIALTGILNMVVAFFYAANKSDETKAGNTGKMADAMRASAEATTAALAGAADTGDGTIRDGDVVTMEKQ